VFLSGPPYAIWQQVLPAYKRAGVYIIPAYVGPLPLSKTVPLNVMDVQTQASAQLLANWFIADSNAQGKALLANTPGYKSVDQFATDFKNAVHAGCSACTIDELGETIPQVTAQQTNQLITSELQKHPSDKYMITCNGVNITGLPSALSAARLSGIKIAGFVAAENQTDIKAGTEVAFTSHSFGYGAWLAVDTAARLVEGMAVASKEQQAFPMQLLTKESLGDATPSNSWDYPSDYQELFKKLWKVS
jgi:ribose transport system substrate-binding protein